MSIIRLGATPLRCPDHTRSRPASATQSDRNRNARNKFGHTKGESSDARIRADGIPGIPGMVTQSPECGTTGVCLVGLTRLLRHLSRGRRRHDVCADPARGPISPPCPILDRRRTMRSEREGVELGGRHHGDVGCRASRGQSRHRGLAHDPTAGHPQPGCLRHADGAPSQRGRDPRLRRRSQPWTSCAACAARLRPRSKRGVVGQRRLRCRKGLLVLKDRSGRTTYYSEGGSKSCRSLPSESLKDAIRPHG